jgi:2-polyprenyl-3-methyl-5-hydroxy-6-metoxy-1,4-benzoquinol methylase
MKCVLCSSRKFKTLFRVGDRDLLECSYCGLVRTKQKPKATYDEYHRDLDYKKFENHFKNIFEKRFNIVKRFKKKGRVLDVGTSTGAMLDIFARHGWECWGVEPSKNAKVAISKGYKIINTEFESANIPNGYFDAIVLNHTLEHMKNPVLVLEKVRKLLKKGGIVLVDVPNFGSLSEAIKKEKWPYILPEEHTYHFTETTLRKLFKYSGFKVLHTESRSGIFESANIYKELVLSLVTLKKRFFTNIFGFPGAFISTALNRGTSISIVGKKVE